MDDNVFRKRSFGAILGLLPIGSILSLIHNDHHFESLATLESFAWLLISGLVVNIKVFYGISRGA